MVKFTVCKYKPKVIGEPKTFEKLAVFTLPNTFEQLVDTINMHRSIMLQEIGLKLGHEFKFYYRDESEGYLVFIGST